MLITELYCFLAPFTMTFESQSCYQIYSQFEMTFHWQFYIKKVHSGGKNLINAYRAIIKIEPRGLNAKE